MSEELPPSQPIDPQPPLPDPIPPADTPAADIPPASEVPPAAAASTAATPDAATVGAGPTLNYSNASAPLTSLTPYVGAPPTPDEKNMGMLAHLLGIFTFFIGPLIIWLMKKDQSQWINDQGKEALNFQIFAGICIFASAFVICVPLLGVLLFGGLQLARIVFGILATVEASKGVAYRYPVNLRLIK